MDTQEAYEVYQHHTDADTHDQVGGCMCISNRTEARSHPDHGYLRWEGSIQRSRYLRSRDTMPSGVEDVCTLATAL